MPKANLKEPSEHIHSWTLNPDQVSMRCVNYYQGYPCIKIRVSKEEFDRREQEWNNYYEMVKTTSSYKDSIAFKNHEISLKELLERIDKRTVKVFNEYGDPTLELIDPLPSPTFPDPQDPKQYYIY